MKVVYAISTVKDILHSNVLMLKASILSVRKNAPSLQPVVIMQGSHPELELWLTQHSTIIINHEPDWAPAVVDIASRTVGLKEKSHLGVSMNSLVGTFMRIDICMVGFTDEYALYVDTDTIFLRDVVDFSSLTVGGVMPKYYACMYESKGAEEYCNNGVMLLNLVNLYLTYDEFLKFILSSDLNHYEGNHNGGGDQGAYMAFYKEWGTLGEVWNWRPYWGIENGKDIGIYGPKILDYVRHKASYFLFESYVDMCHEGCQELVRQSLHFYNTTKGAMTAGYDWEHENVKQGRHSAGKNSGLISRRGRRSSRLMVNVTKGQQATTRKNFLNCKEEDRYIYLDDIFCSSTNVMCTHASSWFSLLVYVRREGKQFKRRLQDIDPNITRT